ncbi:MAG: hypothetical protein ACTIJ6_06115 [Leucobacter sp.]
MSTIPFPPEPEQTAEPAQPATGAPGTTSSTDHPITATTTTTELKPEKSAPRTSPIMWGSLILVFCAYVFVRAEGWSVDTTTWIIMTIIGIGALLLVVGIVVLLRNSRESR